MTVPQTDRDTVSLLACCQCGLCVRESRKEQKWCVSQEVHGNVCRVSVEFRGDAEDSFSIQIQQHAAAAIWRLFLLPHTRARRLLRHTHCPPCSPLLIPSPFHPLMSTHRRSARRPSRRPLLQTQLNRSPLQLQVPFDPDSQPRPHHHGVHQVRERGVCVRGAGARGIVSVLVVVACGAPRIHFPVVALTHSTSSLSFPTQRGHRARAGDAPPPPHPHPNPGLGPERGGRQQQAAAAAHAHPYSRHHHQGGGELEGGT